METEETKGEGDNQREEAVKELEAKRKRNRELKKKVKQFELFLKIKEKIGSIKERQNINEIKTPQKWRDINLEDNAEYARIRESKGFEDLVNVETMRKELMKVFEGIKAQKLKNREKYQIMKAEKAELVCKNRELKEDFLDKHKAILSQTTHGFSKTHYVKT